MSKACYIKKKRFRNRKGNRDIRRMKYMMIHDVCDATATEWISSQF